MRIFRWLSEWIETWRVAPPFSRRRQELISVLNDRDPDAWVEAKDYWADDPATESKDGS